MSDVCTRAVARLEAGRGLASHCLASLTFTATFASRSAISQRGHFICVLSQLFRIEHEHTWSKSGTYWHNAMAHVIQIYIFDNSRDFAKKNLAWSYGYVEDNIVSKSNFVLVSFSILY